MLKKKNFRIGILGGTFDPAHKGHLKISKESKRRFNLDKIIWAITKKNPFKIKSVSSLKSRIIYAKKFTKKERFIKVRFYEKKINSNKTIHLINYITKNNNQNEVYFIIGADNLINFHKWKKWKEILNLCKILVFDRQGYKSKSLKSKAARYMNKNNWEFVKSNKINISSSKIKKI